jgi:uncharacterized membrane protein
MKPAIFWQLWSWLMSRYVLYMLGLIMGIHCIVSVIEVAAESPACEDAFEVYLIVKQFLQVS